MPKGQAPQRGLELRQCIACETEFQPYRDFHVACGKRSCRAKARDLNPLRRKQEIACKTCGERFEADWSGIGRPPPCPDCYKAAEKIRADRKNAARRVEVDPERRREINLRTNLRHQYGLSLDQYRAMLAEQDGKCALCGFTPLPGAVKAASRLHVDHDHVTGAVRRLLCNGCNRGLGYLQDSPALLRAAADYIERHRASPEP